MQPVLLRTDQGQSLDARVDVEPGAIIVHSRSGGGATARNPEYREAVEAILTRLDRANLRPDVYLDSRPVSHLPLEHRRIASATALSGTPSERFSTLVRSMNAGSQSNGAWRRIRFALPGVSESKLLDVLSDRELATPQSPVGKPARLSSAEQRRVTAGHVDAAVASLLSGIDAPQFADSRDYDLITPDGDQLPPKKVFGRSLELAGVVRTASPYHFSAGWSQPSFELLQAAGYAILPKSEAPAEAARRQRAKANQAEVEKEAATVGVDPEERRWIEGDKRIAKHLRIERRRSSKAAQLKRAQVRAANGGRLACEHCSTDWYAVYSQGVAEAIFDVHHTKPLKDMDEGHETAVGDLLCLCANCHRAEHRRMACSTGS